MQTFSIAILKVPNHVTFPPWRTDQNISLQFRFTMSGENLQTISTETVGYIPFFHKIKHEQRLTAAQSEVRIF